MKKKLFTSTIILLVTSLTIISCKKSATTSTPSSGGSSTTGSSFTIGPNGDPSGTYSGIFFEYSFGSPTNLFSEVLFYNTPVAIRLSTNNIPISSGTVSSVYCNNVKFKYNTLDYTDSTYTVTFPSAVWLVNGNATFPSFTYTCSTPIPVYTGTNLPSTVNRTQNLVIPISGASGYDQIQVEILDGSNHGTSVFASASATSITISKDSLTQLSATPSGGSININLSKYNPQTFGSKNYLFATFFNYSKMNITIQ